jgi:polyphosphate glucokinase
MAEAAAPVLTVDVGGSHVKALVSGESERRRFDSGSELGPQEMVEGVLQAAAGWSFERVSVGIPRGDNERAFAGGFRLWDPEWERSLG